MSPYVPPDNTPLDIAFSDESLLVVNKPSGLLSVPGRGPEKADCLVSRLNVDFPDALIVHRLDMETSGLMVLARNKDTHRHLSKSFELRKVDKTYIARVSGILGKARGEIELPLMKDWPNRPLQKVDMTEGKRSLTHWEILETEDKDSITRVKLSPQTGRTHQLRVHMNAIGHPILGDLLYGTPQSKAGAARLQLHASTLAFAHPVTAQRLVLQSPAPF